MLPNFLFLGAPRCASTWIFHCLREHPWVFVPKEKELRFFDENYEKGLDWYEKKFAQHKDEKAVGEVATKYLSHREAPKRIKKDLPEVRLIVCLRDPVERAYSAYGNDWRQGKTSSDFERAIQENYTEYIKKGLYAEQIKRYLKRFSRKRMLILFYEDLERAPHSFIKKIYNFIRVNSEVVPSGLERRRNRGVTMRNRYGFFVRVADCLLKIPVIGAGMNYLKRRRFVDNFLEDKVLAEPRRKMDPDTRRQLQKIFRESNEELSRVLGKDLMEYWK